MELTPRQQQVVRLLAHGCTMRESAKILGVSVSTVDNTIQRAKERVGIYKNVPLGRWAAQVGIAPLDGELTSDELARMRQSTRKHKKK